jgi:hypothetical protein
VAAWAGASFVDGVLILVSLTGVSSTIGAVQRAVDKFQTGFTAANESPDIYITWAFVTGDVTANLGVERAGQTVS